MKAAYFLAAAAAGLHSANAITLDDTSEDSIRSAASTMAYGLMSYYSNNLSTTASYQVGTFSPPLATWYWWEAGAAWGALLDYWAYTGDETYNPTVTEALLAQVGDNNDYMPSYYAGSMGNDDQAFWAAAALTALEYGYPEPPNGTAGNPTWLSLSKAVWSNLISRWNDTQCGGGLKWQVYSSNSGYDYKQTISNAGLFQISARLARYTGNETYYNWAVETWDWLTEIGFLTEEGAVYDGASDLTNCTDIDKIQWTYNAGMLLYGAASLYNYTDGSDVWQTRTNTLLTETNTIFFNALDNSTGIMVEQACEPHYTCDNDQWSFKAYLGRWMGKTTIVAPFTYDTIMPLLRTSATAAATACSGPSDGVTCGARWYIGGYDGSYGIGQQLSALEVTQSLLVGNAPLPAHGEDVEITSTSTSSSSSSTSTSSSSSSTTSSSATETTSGNTPSTTQSTTPTTSSSTTTSTTSSIVPATTQSSAQSTTQSTIKSTTSSTTHSTTHSTIRSTTTSPTTSHTTNSSTTRSTTPTTSQTSTSSTPGSTSNQILGTSTSAATATQTSKGAAAGSVSAMKRGVDGVEGVIGIVVVMQVVGLLFGLGCV